MNRKFFNLSLDLLCIVRPCGTFVRANPAFCELLGFSENELQSKTIFDFIHPDDLKSSYDECDDVQGGKEVDSYTNRYLDREGKIHLISWRTRFVEEENLIYGSGRDITESANFENQLKNAVNLLNYTGSIGKIGGWDLIIDTETVFWTEETYKILEMDIGEKKPSMEETLSLFIGEYQDLYRDAVTKAIEEGLPYDLEAKIKTLKGREMWVFVSGRPVVENSKVVRLLGVIQDIDDKKKAEEELKREHQKSMLQSKLASIGELAAGVGHEINNPLAIAVGNLHRLKKNKDLSPEMMEILKNLESAHERIKKITLGLRDLSRTETEKSVFDFRQVINDFLLFVQKIYEFQNISLEFTTASTSNNGKFNILANRAEIQQVLMNLVSNARDALYGLENKRVSLHLESQKDNVLFKVTDNGKGIATAIKDKVFESFYTTKKIGEGTGLGLALTHRIVKDHGGHIWLESQQNIGTTFFLSFPHAKGHFLKEHKKSEKVKLYQSGLKVLVLDDEEGIRYTLEYMLEDLGCQVSSVATANEAISLLEKKHFDIIISDILMPKVTGANFFEILKEKDLLSNSKFLFITGGVNQKKELDHSQIDYDGLIMKPFNEEDLISTIHACLKEK